jgi:curved DNA-binding protein CbpA
MNYFDIFEIEKKFLLEKEDEEKIENQYLSLQKQNQNTGDVINLKIKIINEAYETIKDDCKRAEYLLKMLEINPEAFQMSPDLIEYIIEVREDLMDSETEQEIQEKISDIIIELEEAMIELSENFTLYFKKKLDIQELASSFMRFKCLYEIVKKHKKGRV